MDGARGLIKTSVINRFNKTNDSFCWILNNVWSFYCYEDHTQDDHTNWSVCILSKVGSTDYINARLPEVHSTYRDISIITNASLF